MENINIKTTAKHLSIQEGFEWKDIPQFAIITGVNGAGKTHLLDVLRNDKGVDIFNGAGTPVALILSMATGKALSIDGLIDYKNQYTQRLIRKTELDNHIRNNNIFIERKKKEIAVNTDKIDTQRLLREINVYQGYNENYQTEIKALFVYAYEEELKRVLQETEKKEIEEITDTEIREFANPYFNTLSEIQDFEKFIRQEEQIRNDLYVKLSKEKRENEISGIRDKERAFEKINKLFKKYGFTYFEMLDPFPSDKSRNGKVLFKGLKDEIVQYSSLSSGEQMIVKFIIWAMATDIRGDRINTMLLDEPDAHLHPSMCKMMVEILQEISQPKELGGSGIRVIITTHSPSTVAFAPAESLFIMEKNFDNDRIIKPTTTEDAVRILSDGVFTFEKAINQFTLVAKSDKNNILFVEGKTDVNHLKKAIVMLEYNLDLEIIDMHDAGALSSFIRSTPSKLCNGKTLIALFDCDNEGKRLFNNIPGDIVIANAKRLTATQCENKSFASTIQPPTAFEKYCPIEFLYPFEYLKDKNVLERMDFQEYKTLFKTADPEEDERLTEEYKNGTSLRAYKVKDEEKTRFSKSIESETDITIFQNFKPTIELIKKIIEYQGD